MAQVINTNILSLNAQRNLTTSQASLATSVQRLSSGLRINSAKDDAAGLAISERFTTQIRGLNQAIRNANDGISLSQTAEGAMASIGNNLQRIRELAVQSRNATNSTSDREALQAEVDQLKEEIGRVATQTSFNGIKLLDGSFTAQAFQVGADQGQTINIDNIANAQIDSLGTWTSVDTPAVAGAVTLGEIDSLNFFDDGTTNNNFSFDVGDSAGTPTTVTLDQNYLSFDALVTDVQDQLGAGYVVSRDGAKLVITAAVAGTTGASVEISGTTANDYTGNDFTDAASLVTVNAADVIVGFEQTGFSNLDISDTAGADNAILAMDAALTVISSSRADLGAIQNRFMSTIENLSITAENLTASRSRIMDADFAAETAALSRAQILQQAGTAMVAQANQVPQGVLQLLQG